MGWEAAGLSFDVGYEGRDRGGGEVGCGWGSCIKILAHHFSKLLLFYLLAFEVFVTI